MQHKYLRNSQLCSLYNTAEYLSKAVLFIKGKNKLISSNAEPYYCWIQYYSTIDCFHMMSSLSKIQNKRATKVFVLIRHKRRYIYICLQLYSSIACFVWNPEHFEFQGYGGCVTQGYDRVCWKIYTYLVVLNLFRR